MTQKYTTNVVFLALTAIWVALVLACAWIPAYPVLGTTAVITFSSILFSALTAPILGLLWGTVSGFVFGWLVPFVNPGAAFLGPLTFLTPTMAALMSGLVLFSRWKEATLIFSLEMVIWFLHPFAWYQAMPITTWQYWVVLAFIIIPPVRKWIVGSITSRNPANLTAALWCLAWIALISDTATGNNIAIWALGYGNSNFYSIWVPMTGYYAIAGALNCLAGATIGTAVLLALRKANLRVLAVDFLKTEK